MGSQLFDIGQPRRLFPVALCALLAMTPMGCGDSEERESSGGGGGAASTSMSTDVDSPSRVDTPSGPGAEGAGHSRPTLAGDRAQARVGARAIDDIYADLADVAKAPMADVEVSLRAGLDAADADPGLRGVCALLSERAKRQTIVYGKRASGLGDVDWTCEKATVVLLRRARRTGRLERSLEATVVGVNAEGDRATATMRFGGPRGQLSTVPMVREDGEWKLAAAAAGGDG
jgi:hypothetical protein